jgi:hypothetical protein
MISLAELLNSKSAFGLAFLGLGMSLAMPPLCNQSEKCDAHTLALGAMYNATMPTLAALSASYTSVSAVLGSFSLISELGNPQADETIKLPPPVFPIAASAV